METREKDSLLLKRNKFRVIGLILKNGVSFPQYLLNNPVKEG